MKRRNIMDEVMLQYDQTPRYRRRSIIDRCWIALIIAIVLAVCLGAGVSFWRPL